MQCIHSHDGLNEHCVWQRTPPTALVNVIYGFVVPTLAGFGLCANFINAIVFMRPKMTPSAFSYLAALSWMDCLSCLLITLTAFSRSIFFNSGFWLAYDFCWQTPLFGITTGAANLILACVSADRFIYLWSGRTVTNTAPRFCRRKLARRMICAVVLFSTLLNLPYFFVFIVNKDGTFQATEFYLSSYYRVHNWLTFVLLAVLPAIFLLAGNTAIIIAFRRWAKQRQLCQKSCKKLRTAQKRYQHQTKLTITIVIVITLYIIGELPAHLTSRKSVLNLLFNGDPSKVNLEIIERLEIIFISLNALQLSLNIVVYALINPCFIPEFFTCLRGASDVCFRVLGITTIGKMCKRKGSNRSTSTTEEETSESVRPSCEGRRELSHRYRRNTNRGPNELITFSKCNLGAYQYDGEVILRNKWNVRDSDRFTFSSSRTFSADGKSWCGNLHTNWVWKRSSSLDDISIFNFAMWKERLEHTAAEEGIQIRKRHSLSF